MSEQTKKIIYWILTGLIAFVFVGSAIGKFTADANTLKLVESIGLNANTYKLLGVIELISVLLFIFPRTGILGVILLVSYMGGAIATHLESGQSVVAPCIIQTALVLISFYRFPELVKRINNK
jgi:hypothetical protein